MNKGQRTFFYQMVEKLNLLLVSTLLWLPGEVAQFTFISCHIFTKTYSTLQKFTVVSSDNICWVVNIKLHQ